LGWDNLISSHLFVGGRFWRLAPPIASEFLKKRGNPQQKLAPRQFPLLRGTSQKPREKVDRWGGDPIDRDGKGQLEPKLILNFQTGGLLVNSLTGPGGNLPGRWGGGKRKNRGGLFLGLSKKKKNFSGFKGFFPPPTKKKPPGPFRSSRKFPIEGGPIVNGRGGGGRIFSAAKPTGQRFEDPWLPGGTGKVTGN